MRDEETSPEGDDFKVIPVNNIKQVLEHVFIE